VGSPCVKTMLRELGQPEPEELGDSTTAAVPLIDMVPTTDAVIGSTPLYSEIGAKGWGVFVASAEADMLVEKESMWVLMLDILLSIEWR
jgi:hypothetical protein